ncbi:Astacin (Peptidase family M12A) [Bosea sp. LC85]|uniref:M12 family metallopeptidase n=1 Tax=Bosea sp. LC85 TaxID=1502851 RepID=UPI0004E3D2F7|nr:M12 family metallopeptidase [Bosea sp. LC85]KFC61830.1 Astacin (Peptidase family M12A) [Bosea sp. LC85]
MGKKILTSALLFLSTTTQILAHDLRGIAGQLQNITESELDTVRQIEKDRAELIELYKKSPNKNLETVFRKALAWKVGSTIPVCFLDGSSTGRANVAAVASEWSMFANIKFDFGSAPNFRTCSTTNPSKIRVTFKSDGWWSVIGSAATAVKSGPTMGLDGLDNYQRRDPSFRFYVLHEFGHALGLEHEHQSPNVPCEIDFKAAARLFGGDEDKAKTNMSRIKDSRAYITSNYDLSSIMHYSVSPDIFFGKEACVTSNRGILSAQDKKGIAAIYPKQELSEEAPVGGGPGAALPQSPAVERTLERIRIIGAEK